MEQSIFNVKSKTLKLAISGVIIALGVSLSWFYIPIGASKCFPIQHFINVIGAVFLGPIYAVANAFIISLIRNMAGTGSLLAFPGSMIGALLAGYAYKWFKSHRFAALGELVGTGLIGGVVAGPFAILLMGKEVGILFFIVPFLISSFSGSVIAFVLLESSSLLLALRKRKHA